MIDKPEEEELGILLERVSFKNRFLKENEDRYVKLFREYTETNRDMVMRRRESITSDQGPRTRGGREDDPEVANGLSSWYDNLRYVMVFGLGGSPSLQIL
jgi:hypothetical protein